MINIFSGIANSLQNGTISLPMIIAIVLSIAFIAMLLVTLFTLISIKRAELKSRRVIDIPPSAIKDTPEIKVSDNPEASNPWPIGEWLNHYLISRGYIRVNSIVKSFFKALDFLN